MSKKVLVIAEGANDKKIIGRIFSAYEKNIEVFTFKMDVYQLFAIYDKQGADFSELDIQNTLINELKLTPKERDILLNKYVGKISFRRNDLLLKWIDVSGFGYLASC